MHRATAAALPSPSFPLCFHIFSMVTRDIIEQDERDYIWGKGSRCPSGVLEGVRVPLRPQAGLEMGGTCLL